MERPRFDRWLDGQHWLLRYAVYCLRVGLVVAVIYLINRAAS